MFNLQTKRKETFLTRPEKERREIGLVLSPMSFSSCCLPVLFTVKLVVAARRPPRTSSWDCGFLLATDPGSSAGKTQKTPNVYCMWKTCYICCTHVVVCGCKELHCNAYGKPLLVTYWWRETDWRCSCSGASLACWQLHWGRCSYCYCARTPASPHRGPETRLSAYTAAAHQRFLSTIRTTEGRKDWRSYCDIGGVSSPALKPCEDRFPANATLVSKTKSDAKRQRVCGSIFIHNMITIFKIDLIFYLKWPDMSDWAHKINTQVFGEPLPPRASTGPQLSPSGGL